MIMVTIMIMIMIMIIMTISLIYQWHLIFSEDDHIAVVQVRSDE